MRRRRSTTKCVPVILNGYLRVLSTYSGHRSLNDDTRKRLFRSLADLIDNSFDGRNRQGLPDHPIRGPQKGEGIPLQGRDEYADNQDVSRKRGSPARLAAGATSRRSIRLGGYDYSYPGAYFVTVCAARRGPLFGWISEGRVVENANARIVRDCWLDLPNHYPHVSLDTFVVMPDHIHGIIVLLDTHGMGDVRKDDVRAGLEVRAGLKPARYRWGCGGGCWNATRAA